LIFSELTIALESEVHAGFDLVTAGGDAFQLAGVEEGVVVTHKELEVSDLYAHAAAKQEVEAIGVTLVSVMIVGI